MKIRHVVIATAAYFASLVVAITIGSKIVQQRPFDENDLGPAWWWVVIGFYGLSWEIVLVIAVAMINKLRVERIMGLRRD